MSLESIPAATSKPRLIALPLMLAALVSAALAVTCILVLSAARAYVGGEGLYTRAQKEAAAHLARYAESRSPADWAAYQEDIRVPLGDRQAREEMEKPNYDYEVARQGFIAGLNHPDDVPGLIYLFRWARSLPFMDRTIRVWAEGDRLVQIMVDNAEELHQAITSGAPAAALVPLLQRIQQVDAELTPLEYHFSAILGDAARMTQLLLIGAVLLGTMALAATTALVMQRAVRHDQTQAGALRASETLFRSMWQTTSDAVFIVSEDHVIRFANPAAHLAFGHPLGTLTGQQMAVLHPPRMRALQQQELTRFLGVGSHQTEWFGREVTAQHADGHEFPTEMRFSRFEISGEPAFVGFVRDITERKRAEQAIVEANQLLEQRVQARTHELQAANDRLLELDRMKSQFLATMSHELRTPLNSIIGFTKILQMGMAGSLTPEQKRQIGFVHDSGQHLLALINDLLDLSRIESGHMDLHCEEFDFAEVVAEAMETVRPLADVKSLALRVVGPGAVPLTGDRRKTYQVLLNLLANAVKFTERGHVEVGVEVAGDRLEVSVHDTGPGMTAEQVSQLFEAFKQLDGTLGRSHEGTGLGLYLCRKLLELMQGSVRVRSTPGEGSTFCFELPLLLEEEPAATPVAGAPRAAALPAR